MPTPLPHRPAALALLAGITLATAPACSWNERRHAAAPTSTAAPTTTASTTTTAVSTPEDPEDEVRAAYLEAMRAYFEMVRDPDPADPRIERWFTGASRLRVTQVMTDLAAGGVHVVYDERPTPTIEAVSVDGDRATVRVCLIDRSVQVDSDGRVVDDTNISELNQARLTRSNHRWTVTTQRGIDAWPDDAGCSR